MRNNFRQCEVFHNARMIECEPAIDCLVVWYGGETLKVFTMTDWHWLQTLPISTSDAEIASIAARTYLNELAAHRR